MNVGFVCVFYTQEKAGQLVPLKKLETLIVAHCVRQICQLD